MDIQYLKGVGEKRVQLLHKLGLFSSEDLLTYYPRDYEDRTEFKRLCELLPGESVCVRATVSSPVQHSFVRKGMDLFRTTVFDDSGQIPLTFFNAPYVRNSLKQGEGYAFYGKVSASARGVELVNPVFEPLSAQGRITGRIMPLYRSTAGCPQALLRSAAAQALDRDLDTLPDALPDALRAEYQLCHMRFAVQNIHFPQTESGLLQARRRLVFEELLVLQLGLLRLKGQAEKGRRFTPVSLEDFRARLGFSLTEGQERALSDALGDMQEGRLMARLIQGDVGSGKTAVAAACALAAVRNGVQAAMMAPTEILAEQHFVTLAPLLEPLGVRTACLTGSLTPAKKRALHAALAAGEIDFCLGTHALVSDTVSFAELGLVITDEQHRFGVRQRKELTEKGSQPPHRLVMSATPIPRTLSMILYGDLDVTVMRGLPPGRKPVKTYVVTEDMRARIEAFVRKLVEDGRQVYIVCPLIEDEGAGPASVESYAKRLREDVFPDLRVGVIHGRLKPRAKEEAMRAFAAHESDILVATTVIEVGVNVPNAALMIVENAELFGLSQLHQLRGRVGRGDWESHCVLFLQSVSDTARKRLDVMRRCNDGFEIAEADLEMRGPGDVFGDRQHGLPVFKLADLSSDAKLLEETAQAARAILARDPALALPEHAALSALADRLISQTGRD